MSNESRAKFAMPVALVIFGILILLGMKFIADGIAAHGVSVSSAIDKAASNPVQLGIQGLDTIGIVLDGTEEGNPIIVKTKLFN